MVLREGRETDEEDLAMRKAAGGLKRKQWPTRLEAMFVGWFL